MPGDEVRESVRRVAAHRSAPRSPLSLVLAGYSAVAQNKWAAWVRKQELTDRLPLTFDEVLVDFEYWHSHVLPIAGLVVDPATDRIGWCDITAHLRENPAVIDQGPFRMVS